MTDEMWQIAVLPKESDVNIMLLGSTGSGKSASGNTIIGRDRGFQTFTEGFSSGAVTKNCQCCNAELDLNGYKRTINVMDTPGLSDIDVKIFEAQRQIVQMLNKSDVDVFLLVIKLGDKFTTVESNVLKWIQDNFGAKVLKRTIVLFTHGDELHQPVESYLSKSKPLWSIVHQCFGRYHVFNNRVKDPAQVSELLDMIRKIRMMNGKVKYTSQDYRESQDALACKDSVIVAAVVAVVIFMVSSGLGGGIGISLYVAFFVFCFCAREK